MTHPLTQFRKKNGDMSMATLARLAGTTRQTIHRIENGEQDPSFDMIRRLVAATKKKVRPADFIRDEEVAA